MTRALVLLAAYNGAAWIEGQVSSILAQRDVEVEVMIGDDASRDDTLERLAIRFAGDARVRVISWDRASGSAGANFLRLMRAADASGFDVVALSDQDDEWFPDKLAAGVAALRTSAAAGFSAAVTARWDNGRETVLTQCPQTRRADFLFEGAGQGCTFVLGHAFFGRVQRFLASKAGQGTDMHFHDWMLYVLSRAWGERWVFDPTPRMVYRQHADNEIGARGGSSALARRLGKIRDGWYAAQIAKAGAVYEAAGGTDPSVLRLVRELERGRARGPLASAGLALRLWRDGRRRAVDRAVLVVAALARWI